MSSLAEAQRAAGADGHEPPPDEPPFIKLLRRIDRAVARVEEILLLAFVAILIAVGVYAVIAREIFRGQPEYTVWTFEVIRYAVFFIGCTGAALATQADRLFNIDSFTRVFSPRGRLVVRLITAAFTIFICVLLVRAGFSLRAVVAGERTEIVPPGIGALSLPVAFSVIIGHIGLHMLIDLQYLARGKVPPELARVQAPKA